MGGHVERQEGNEKGHFGHTLLTVMLGVTRETGGDFVHNERLAYPARPSCESPTLVQEEGSVRAPPGRRARPARA
jgi:hypothetical protein